MKFHDPLNEILGSRSKVAVLRLLSTGRTMTGSQIATELQMSVWSCHQTLKELAGMGVLLMRNTGHSHLFWLPQGTYVWQELLLPLFEKESKLLDRYLDKALKNIKPHCLSVMLYGSVARGEEETWSDVDLLFVTETVREASIVRSLTRRNLMSLISEFGNPPSFYILTRRQLLEKQNAGLPLIKNIRREGKVLHGSPLEEILLVAA